MSGKSDFLPQRLIQWCVYHCQAMFTLKQTMDAENVLPEQDKVIDFPLKPSDLSRYDEVLYD